MNSKSQDTKALLQKAESALLTGEQDSVAAHLQSVLALQPAPQSRHAVCIWFLRQMRMRLDPRDGRLDRLALSQALPPPGIGRAPAISRLLMLVEQLGVAVAIRHLLASSIAQAPSDAGLQLMAGQLALLTDDRSAAEAHLRRSVDLGFPSPTPLLGLAQLANRHGHHQLQRNLVTRAAAAFPLYIDTRGIAKAERLLILNALPRPWCSDWRDAYNQSNLIRSYAPFAGRTRRGLDVLMLGGVTLQQIETMALPPASAILNNLGNAEVMAQAGHARLIDVRGLFSECVADKQQRPKAAVDKCALLTT